VHDILARGPCTGPPHRSGRVVGSEALNEHNKHTDKHRERQWLPTVHPLPTLRRLGLRSPTLSSNASSSSRKLRR
jgi:hypothetical protein